MSARAFAPVALAYGVGIAAAGFGCVEVLDFGEVCEAPVPFVDVTVIGADPISDTDVCPARDSFDVVSADATAQGADPIDMTVDPSSLVARGVLARVSAGLLRTVLVSHRVGEVPLSYQVASVDLFTPTCANTLDLDLGADGVLVTRPAELEALLASDGDFDHDWLDAQVSPDSLDQDGDGCSNLQEACVGVLGDPSHLAACP